MNVFFELYFIKRIFWLIYWLKYTNIKETTKMYWNTAERVAIN